MKEPETGNYYYGARYYTCPERSRRDPKWSIWLSVDPLAHKYPSMSPYAYTLWNPVKYVDPDGRSVAPIYGKKGNFLGTDDEGLQGKAIVMNRNKFIQGMSHERALSMSLGPEGLVSNAAKTKLLIHKAGLKNRPDWDGKLTLLEVVKWYNGGSGKPLFVDAGKIDLSPLTMEDFKSKKSRYINFFKGEYQNLETGPIYGNLHIKVLNSKSGTVKIGVCNKEYGGWIIDKYDFADPKFKKAADYLYPGKPKEFFIIGYQKKNTIPID